MNTGKRTPRNFAEWIGFSRRPIYENALWFGPIFGATLLVIALILMLASLAILCHFFFALFGVGIYEPDQSGEALRNIGLVLVGLFGAPLLVWRSAVVARQTDIAAESLFNDKINAAAEALSARYEVTTLVEASEGPSVVREWKDDLVARVAAIDRLHGLVGEDSSASERVARLLAAYVRGNFPCKELDPTPELKKRRTPRMDQQKAIDVIGKILPTVHQSGNATLRLDLTKCDFDGVDFSDGYFRAVDFSECRFEAAIFDGGVFEGCYFRGSLLNYARFYGANLRGARFDRVVLNEPSPVPGGFVESLNMADDLTGVTFIAADISALDHLGDPSLIAKIFATKDTKISRFIQSKMLDSSAHRSAFTTRSYGKRNSLTDADAKKVDELEATGFIHWSPFNSHDLATGGLVAQFYRELGMTNWPFTRN